MRLHPGGYGRHPGGTNLLNIAQSIRIASERDLRVRNIQLFNHLQGQCSPFQAAALMISKHQFPSVGRPTGISNDDVNSISSRSRGRMGHAERAIGMTLSYRIHPAAQPSFFMIGIAQEGHEHNSLDR